MAASSLDSEAEGFEHLILLKRRQLRSSSEAAQVTPFRQQAWFGTESDKGGAAEHCQNLGDRTTGQHDIRTCHGSGSADQGQSAGSLSQRRVARRVWIALGSAFQCSSGQSVAPPWGAISSNGPSPSGWSERT